MTLPPAPPETRRRFFGVETALDDPAARSFLIERLLEEGDRRDFDWLKSRVRRAEIEAVLRRSGGRKLSARSRRFWARLFGVPVPRAPRIAEELWPLC